MIRRIAKGLGLICFGLLLGFALAEGALRLFYEVCFHLWDSYEIFRAIPIQKSGWHISREFKVKVERNSKGLRDYEYSYKKPPNVFRILVLGDSYMEALQVPLEDSFPKLLERYLNRRRNNLRFEVINGGVSNYGTADELIFFRKEGKKYQPDLVLLAFLTGNDVRNNSSKLETKVCGGLRPYFILKGGRLELDPDAKRPEIKKECISFKALLHRYSRFYSFTVNIIKKNISWVVLPLIKIGLVEKQQLGHLRGEIPFDYFVYATCYDPNWEEAWRITEALIYELKREVEGIGSKFAVVILTDPGQVHPEYWRETLETYPKMKERQWDLDKPCRLLANFLEEEGIPHYELLPHFREYAQKKGKKLHSYYDGHWNKEGHNLAASLTYNYLVKKRLIMRGADE